MAAAIRTVLSSGLFVCLICFTLNHALAGGYSMPVAAVPAPAVVAVPAPGGVVTAPTVVPMPVGSFADVRDFPGGVVYGGSYRVMSPILNPVPVRPVRRVVRYGRSDFVGPRGYAAVVTPWPLIPVTTSAQPYGVGVVPLSSITAWQSPRGYLYRSNYQSAVMQPGGCPQATEVPAESIEIVPQGTPVAPMEPIPAPAAEIGPEF
ncbi:MAG: hypothetical protein JXM70_19820 [Pirellulales bacterium]|nr:hypothetical protein [Pirellulales bacterium]